jgi:phage terminase large subunit-like protein
VWLDGKPLLSTIEPYRQKIFDEALTTIGSDGWPQYNRVLCGRAKKNFKTSDLILASLYRFIAYPSAAGNDCFIIANDEEQAGDDLSLAKKLIRANPSLDAEVEVFSKEIVRRDGAGRMKILPAQDVLGLHGKTYLFLGFDEIHGYKDYGLFEALSPDPTRPDTLVWITSYAGLRHAEGIPLYDLLRLGKSGDDPGMYFSWYGADFTTDAALQGDDVTPEVRANPSLGSWGSDRYLVDQKRRLPNHRFRRLHLNLQGAPDGAAFNADTVIDSIVRGRRRLSPEPGRRYFGFTDMSGGSSDDATLAIAHTEDGRIVIDLLVSQEVPCPFNPRQAVTKFAAILKEYGLHRVTGDKFGGETFLYDFRDEGITYDVSELNRSQLYESFEPKLNAGIVELPDLPKLQEQLLTLVVKPNGRIDHQAGDHDDWANACAGVVSLIATEQAPSLIRVSSLYVDDAPVVVPSITEVLYSTFIIGDDGVAAEAYFASSSNGLFGPEIPALVLLDFRVAHMTTRTIPAMYAHLDEFATKVRLFHTGSAPTVFVPPYGVGEIRELGFGCDEIPESLLKDPRATAQIVAGHTRLKKVLAAVPAAHRAQVHPLKGALSYRPDERVDADALRWALILGITIGLTENWA